MCFSGWNISFTDHQYENHCKLNTNYDHKYIFWLEYNILYEQDHYLSP